MVTTNVLRRAVHEFEMNSEIRVRFSNVMRYAQFLQCEGRGVARYVVIKPFFGKIRNQTRNYSVGDFITLFAEEAQQRIANGDVEIPGVNKF